MKNNLKNNCYHDPNTQDNYCSENLKDLTRDGSLIVLNYSLWVIFLLLGLSVSIVSIDSIYNLLIGLLVLPFLGFIYFAYIYRHKRARGTCV